MVNKKPAGVSSVDNWQRVKNAALAGSMNAIALADLSGRLVYVNAAFLDLWQYAEEDVLGQPAVDFWKHPSEAAQIIDILEQEGTWVGEIVARRKDNSQFSAQISASLVCDLAGQPLCMLGVFVDMTRYRETERYFRRYSAQLNERVKELSTLYEVSSLAEDPTTTERAYLEQVVALLPQGWQHSEDACAQIRIAERAYATANYQKTPWQQHSAISTNGESVGELTVGYLSKQPQHDEGPFLVEERDLIDEVARIIGRFLARNQFIFALQESEERFRATFEQAAVGLAQVAPNGRFMRVNQKLCEIFGYSADELLKLTFQEITYVEDLEADLAFVEEMLAGERRSYSMEKRYVRSDGRVVWAMLTVALTHDDEGKPKYFISVVEDISGRKQTELALSQGEARYRTLFEDSPIALFQQDFSAVREQIAQLDREGIADYRAFFESHPDIVSECISLVQIVAINQASLGLYGASNKQELLASLDQLIPSDVQRFFVDELVWIAEGRTSFSWEGMNRKLDGEYIHIRLHWSVPSGYEETLERVLVSIEDITARKQMEAALLDSEERYRNVSELTSDFAFAIGMRADGTPYVQWVTDAFMRITGYSAKKLSHPNEWRTVIHPDDHDKTEAAIEKLMAGDAVVYETRIRTKGGTWRWLRLHVRSSFDAQGQRVVALQGAGQDITDYKRIEQEMIRRERLAAMGQITATLAHEIKNPLQAIQANLDLLSDYPLEADERNETLAICRQELRHLVEITQSILGVGRSDSDVHRSISIKQIWQSAFPLVAPQLADAGIECQVDLPDSLPRIRGSLEKLSQVMLNLLLNAIENMSTGGRLAILGRREDSVVSVTITNDGPAIPTQILDSLFEPFVTTKPQGTGLGLFVSHTILQQHNGTLSAENLPDDRGVSFSFKLPIFVEETNP